jgi:hypothetical protein
LATIAVTIAQRIG